MYHCRFFTCNVPFNVHFVCFEAVEKAWTYTCMCTCLKFISFAIDFICVDYSSEHDRNCLC